MRPITVTAMLGAALLAGSGCSDLLTGPRRGTLVTGEWSAPEVLLTLDRQGGATEYGCAHGGLYDPVILDANGRFEVEGVHVPEHGGPVHEDEAVDSLPALYSGKLVGTELVLTVRVGADTMGPFVLRRDGPAWIVKCL